MTRLRVENGLVDKLALDPPGLLGWAYRAILHPARGAPPPADKGGDGSATRAGAEADGGARRWAAGRDAEAGSTGAQWLGSAAQAAPHADRRRLPSTKPEAAHATARHGCRGSGLCLPGMDVGAAPMSRRARRLEQHPGLAGHGGWSSTHVSPGALTSCTSSRDAKDVQKRRASPKYIRCAACGWDATVRGRAPRSTDDWRRPQRSRHAWPGGTRGKRGTGAEAGVRGAQACARGAQAREAGQRRPTAALRLRRRPRSRNRAGTPAPAAGCREGRR